MRARAWAHRLRPAPPGAEPSAAAVMLIPAVALVFAVAGTVYLVRPWPVVGDWAVAEIIVRHLVHDMPLSGAYSMNRGFNHPLPFMYLLEWLPYHLSGRRSAAAPATQIWWSGAWCVFILWFCARRRALALGVLAVAGLLVMASRIEGAVLIMPWNPNFAVATGLALVFVAWRIALGETGLIPPATAMALWCVGAHLVFLHLAVVLALGVVAGLVVRALARTRTGAPAPPEPPGRLRLRRPLLGALAVTLVMTAPMLVDWARHGDESNPAQLVEHLAPADGESVPGRDVAAVIRGDLAITPAWSQSRLPYSAYLLPPPDWRPLAVVPIVLAVGLALRRRAVDEVAGIGLAFGAVLGCGLGLNTLDAPALAVWYLLAVHVASIALYAFAVWSLARSAGAWLCGRTGRSLLGPRAARAVPAALAVALGAGTAVAVAGWHTPDYLGRIEDTTDEVADAVAARFDPGDPVMVSAPIRFDGYYSQAVTLQLDRAGIDVRVPYDQVPVYTSAIAVSPGWAGAEVFLVFADRPAPPVPGAELLGRAVVPPDDEYRGRWLQAWLLPTRASWDGERLRRTRVTPDTGSSQQ